MRSVNEMCEDLVQLASLVCDYYQQGKKDDASASLDELMDVAGELSTRIEKEVDEELT